MISVLCLAFCMFIYPVQSFFNQFNDSVMFAAVTVMYSLHFAIRSIALKSGLLSFLDIQLLHCDILQRVVQRIPRNHHGFVADSRQFGSFPCTLRLVVCMQGPSLLPILYGWSCHKNYFPIHHGLAFYVRLGVEIESQVLGLVILLAVVIIHFLTDVCDKGRGSITSTIVHSNKQSIVVQSFSDTRLFVFILWMSGICPFSLPF